MNTFPTTLRPTTLATQAPSSFDPRILLLMLFVGAIDLFSGRRVFQRR